MTTTELFEHLVTDVAGSTAISAVFELAWCAHLEWFAYAPAPLLGFPDIKEATNSAVAFDAARGAKAANSDHPQVRPAPGVN
ncbi:hypothetical protein ACIO87_37380 [Streptomyces sp. NPDC087218]|uniref:hypothetical protein n=1 Tax=Streptomyces sp. NPDC087218 TaxID=3365769 RepID=UPI00381A2E22